MFLRLTQLLLRRVILLSTPYTLRHFKRVLTLRPPLASWRLTAVATLFLSINTVLTESQDTELLEEDLERIMKRADVLFANSEFGKLLEFLSPFEECNEPELLWRLSRAYYKVAVASGTTREQAKHLSYKASEVVNRSLTMDVNSFAAHKWAGITLSHIGCYEGLASKIKQAYTVKSHFENSLN